MSKITYFFLKKKKSILIITMALAHFILSISFGILRLQVLTIYNIISTFFYMTMLLTQNRISEYKFLALVSVEIPLYSLIATIYMGNDSGTLLYPFAMMMGVFLFSVNNKYSIKKYILISIPSIISCLLITMWPFEQVLSMDDFKFLFIINKFFSTILAIICILYLSITTHQDLVISNSKNSKYIEKLRFMSNFDPLTKILNRRSTMKKMDSINYFTLVMFDIDDFKKFNDTYGHKAGDEILVELCNRITNFLPENTIFSRWGGEEFIIVFPDQTDQTILKITQLNNIVSSNLFNLSTVQVPITITGGVAFSQPGLSFEKIITSADSLLYEGKKSGKNTIVFPKSH